MNIELWDVVKAGAVILAPFILIIFIAGIILTYTVIDYGIKKRRRDKRRIAELEKRGIKIERGPRG
jgi:hypothetical protein